MAQTPSSSVGATRTAALAWILAANGVTLSAAWLAWPLLAHHDPLVTSRHLAAGLAVLWAAIGWVMGRLQDEPRRWESTTAAVVVARTLTLFAALYAVGICLYYLVPQFGLAVVQTISLHALASAQWFYVDGSGAIDMLAVAAAAMITTHATRSAMLLVPTAWALTLAVAWQCLLIPPIDTARWGGQMTGAGLPSRWLIVMVLGGAALVAVVLTVHRRWSGRCWERALRQDPRYLLRPARPWPGLVGWVTGVGAFVAVALLFMLVFPVSMGTAAPRILRLAAAAAGIIMACALFGTAHRCSAIGLGDLAFGLLTLALCTLSQLVVPDAPQRLEARFPLIFNALIVGCAVSAALWLWLARVWRQQLHPDGRAWTTAGRLIPAALRSSFFAAAIGALFAVQMGIWPLGVPLDDDSMGRLLCGGGAMVLLGATVIRGYLQTRRPAFRSLILLTVFAIALFAVVRILPHTRYF